MIRFDEALPISAHVDQIADALRDHQVLVVAGETGSGKTTQLPKICLRAGRRSIGHTQPRRIAARTLAERIAQEIGEPLGQTVGYQVRFSSKRSLDTRVKVMTDGIMLAEIAHDQRLERYDTIIVDEAHERSLNIDFLLGYLKGLLPKRPELRVVITSATIDTARFSEHFGGAPVIEVGGRTYPVEVQYAPLDEGGSGGDVVDAICQAVRELASLGDTLVFCSGEREIKDVREAVEGMGLPSTEVLPLYARLPAAQQRRVFQPHAGRRVVLATNIAETSVTVPGIRTVVDAGFARISRYSARSKVQRLPIEPVSRASADQRAGRCGRLGPGVCVRLYSEEDYLSRPEFTEPEITRTNLASVILQMAEARLGPIERFGFVDPPDTAQVRDGMRLLRELGALDEGPRRGSGGGRAAGSGKGAGEAGGGPSGPRLTKIGRKLARLPVDPRLGRMLVEAQRLGCLRQVQAVVAGLAVPDVRERPAEHLQAADALHRRFWSPPGADDKASANSDILALLWLWRYLRDARKRLSGNAFRRLCQAEYLNYQRVREWQDLRNQLREACDELRMSSGEGQAVAGMTMEDRVQVSVLAGLLSNVGARQDAGPPTPGKRRPIKEYRGARGAKFAINPGSAAAKAAPPLVMAVELVETSRLWARGVAGIEASWIEEVGQGLLKRSYSQPHWSAKGGQCVAYEKTTLFGIPVVERRLVSYGRIDPVVAREVFIQSALVEGDWQTRHAFWRRNQRVRAEAEELEERTRRRLVDDLALAAFYDVRIPADVVSVAHFDRWWREASRRDPRLLDLSPNDLLLDDTDDVRPDDFPQVWPVDDLELPVDYVYEPGSQRDGVTVEVPLSALNRVRPQAFSWQVPGLREELATALIRGLPKAWRSRLVPAPDTARAALRWLDDNPAPPGVGFPQALSRAVRALRGVEVPDDAWRPDDVPEHLKVRFRVTTPEGSAAVGRDLSELEARLRPQLARAINDAASRWTHPGAVEWRFGELPPRVGGEVVGFPALVDRGDRVAAEVFPDPEPAAASHRAGLRRLIALTTVDPVKAVVARLGNPVKFALAASPYPTVPALLADARLKAIDDLMGADVSAVRDEAAFTALRDKVRGDVAARMQAVVDTAGAVVGLWREVEAKLPGAPPAARDDMAEQLKSLVYPGFILASAEPFYERLPVYLQAMLRRVEQAAANPERDAARQAEVAAIEDAYAELCAAHSVLPPEMVELGWLVEELRVGVFAQGLGTIRPVSAARLRKAMAALAGR